MSYEVIFSEVVFPRSCTIVVGAAEHFQHLMLELFMVFCHFVPFEVCTEAKCRIAEYANIAKVMFTVLVVSENCERSGV
jgi:hypothetical protein